jgi:hypothetical protein
MKIILQMVVILTLGITANGQGSFQDLNFEEANPVSVGNGGYSTGSALPGWQVFIGTTPISEIGIDAMPLSTSTVSLWNSYDYVIDGNYSLLLLGGGVETFGQGGSTPEAASISQTGLIPTGTQSLLFKAVQEGPGPLNVNVGGRSISFAALWNGPNYTLYGANISAWAGQTEALTFTAPGASDANLESLWEIDDITFSPNAVPEPSSLALMGIGGLVFAGYRRLAPQRA